MAGILDVPKPRINCSMLSQFINRAVCFVGRVEKVRMLEEELSGIVEVIGMVSNKGEIMASTYNMLREDKGVPFGTSYLTEEHSCATACFSPCCQ
ncbi:hypothetical protein XENOCAPTIV_016515 [Xenoophorus captivus]|uniref:Replication protein A3 n=1 Tax=Xenoophorus captivus TaxID=1517983 RepID=A0ABV0RHU6_9TELE